MSAWITAGVTTRGTSHIKKDMVCQDAIAEYAIGAFSGIALADGAGSLKYSDIGAQLMTKLSLRYLSRHFNDIYTGVIKQNVLLEKIEHVLHKKAQKLDIEYKELGSTLLIVAVKHNMLISIHIGDGVIAYVDNNDDVKVLSHPMNGEYSNMTFFTTTPLESRMRIGIGELKHAKAFMLMSDGLSDSIYSDKEKSMQQATSLLLTKKVEELDREEVQTWFSKFITHNIVQRTGDDISLQIMHKCEKDTDDILESKLDYYSGYEKKKGEIEDEIRSERRKSITLLVDIQKREMLRDANMQAIEKEAEKKLSEERKKCEIYKKNKEDMYGKRRKIINTLDKEYVKVKQQYSSELETERKGKLKKRIHALLKPLNKVMRIEHVQSRDIEKKDI